MSTTDAGWRRGALAAGVDGATRPSGAALRLDGGDPAIVDGDVEEPIDAAGRVHHPPAGQQQASQGSSEPIRPPQRVGTTAPKFEDNAITAPPKQG